MTQIIPLNFKNWINWIIEDHSLKGFSFNNNDSIFNSLTCHLEQFRAIVACKILFSDF